MLSSSEVTACIPEDITQMYNKCIIMSSDINFVTNTDYS